LAQLLLVVFNAVLFDKGNEIAGRVAGERGLAEVRIRRKKVSGAGMDISEVAATTARDGNLFADSVRVL
jgi:hypothetical protein